MLQACKPVTARPTPGPAAPVPVPPLPKCLIGPARLLQALLSKDGYSELRALGLVDLQPLLVAKQMHALEAVLGRLHAVMWVW